MTETATETIAIAAPPEQVWAIASDVERYPDWAKDVKDVVVHSRDDQGRPAEVEYRASALGRSTHYTLAYDYTSPNVLAWKMVHGDIMRTIDGAYTVSATGDGGTEVRYDLTIELVVPLPGFVKRRAEVRILNTLRELKTRAEAGVPRVSGAHVGVDVGGTKVLGVVADEAGTILHEARRPTPKGGPAILDTVAAVAADLGAGEPGATLGVGIAGLVERRGVLLAAPNLAVNEPLNVRSGLRDRLHVDVAVDNDATCAALAEWRTGAAVGFDDVVLVTLGTGIGGGLVLGGVVQRGAHGFTGEYGHMVVDPDGPPCPCGRRGCWERYASGAGLAWLARRAAAEGRLDVPGGVDELRGEDVRASALAGDERALAVVDEFARWVAIGLVNLTNLVDPAILVLGGGFASDPALYEPPIARWFAALLYSSEIRPAPKLAFATLGEHAGAIGAALLGAAVR